MAEPCVIKLEIYESPGVDDVMDWAVYEKCKHVISNCGLNHEYYQAALKNLAENLGL